MTGRFGSAFPGNSSTEQMPGPVITIFGSSRPVPGDEAFEGAAELGRLLAVSGFTVCNGGYGGIMEASAQGAKQAGGTTIGVVTGALTPRSPNPWIDTVFTENNLIQRMMKLVALGDAYVVLKGGTGTLLELAAVWELMNKQLLSTRPILIVGNFWDGVISTLKDELAWEGLEQCTRYVSVVDSPSSAVRFLEDHFDKRKNT
jgi:uncharacterized protein (TIGR00730 family)